MNLRPYPEYKESGVAWLGLIPAHWDCLPHRAIFNEVKEQGYDDEALLSVTISKGVIKQADLLANSSKKDSSNLDKSKYKLVEPGDIAYNKMRAWQGAVGVSRYRGIVSPAYVVVRSRRPDNPDYFHFLFRTPGFVKEAERWSYGITSDMWSLRPEHFKLIYSCIPSRSEQDAIVAFLRSFAAKVRRFIHNRQRLIEILNEQKQAIINRAVTRGLDPDAPLKPSGIEWLGDIPEHWETSALRLRYEQCLGKMVDEKRFTGVHATPYLRNIDVQWDTINVDNLPLIDIAPHERERFTVKQGDLLVCEGGDVGRSAFWDGQIPLCGFQKALHRLRPKNSSVDYPRFLFYSMFNEAKLGFFVANGSENTIAHLTGVKLRAHRFAFPPFEEQEKIAVYLNEALAHINRAISNAEREIALIREYRTRLISDVVTGKLDVRHLGPELGEDLAEPVDLDEGIDDGDPLAPEDSDFVNETDQIEEE
jgi:type I restriction enzyme, S subunit